MSITKNAKGREADLLVVLSNIKKTIMLKGDKSKNMSNGSGDENVISANVEVVP